MGQTERMIFLLGEMRRQMNGAVADAMHYYGSRYGLNYGVSLPTIRSIAASESKDTTLALYLYKQDVRELRLAALHIAKAEEVDANLETWFNGITTSEIAEEMAFALLRHVDTLPAIYRNRCFEGDELPTYSLLMAAARSSLAAEGFAMDSLVEIVKRFPSSRIIAQGAVALLSAALPHHSVETIKSLLDYLPQGTAAEYIIDEIEWRME